MATWSAVSRIIAALPDTSEGQTREGRRGWSVKDKSLAWERPLRKSDLAALGEAAPKGDILCVMVEDLMTKDAVLQSDEDVFFTTPHFNGFPAVLVKLGKIKVGALKAILQEACRSRTPPKKARAKAKAKAKAEG